MVPFICLIFPAVFSSGLYEWLVNKKASKKRLLWVFLLSGGLINGFCFLLRLAVRGIDGSYGYFYLNMSPRSALDYLAIAVPAAFIACGIAAHIFKEKIDGAAVSLNLRAGRHLRKMLLFAFVCLFIELLLYQRENNERWNLIKQNYYPVREVMEANGYVETDSYVYRKNIQGKEITISFNWEKEECYKNAYIFPASGLTCENALTDQERFVKKGQLEAILNCKLAAKQREIVSEEIAYAQHDWTTFPPVIAHAGGALRIKNDELFYTNSIEALIANYNLGYRVFEFDFTLTRDKKLATVHDWVQFGYYTGMALSAEEWEDYDTHGPYTTCFLDDILDEMLVNRDMFLVTDTKDFAILERDSKIQFQVLYEEAVKRDPELLQRIIPQVYNEDMYEMVTAIYDFPNIIYTTYATEDTAEKIIRFSEKHDNIKVITAPMGDQRFGEAAVAQIHNKGLLLYNHSIYTHAELTETMKKGVDGFYTPLILPSDILLYEQTKNQEDVS